jgi:hypothetical protein
MQMNNKGIEYWFTVYLQWFDYVVGVIGPDIVFVVSLGAVAIGVQLNCHGSRRSKAWCTSAGLTLTGTVAIGQGIALAIFVAAGGNLRPWFWLTAWLVLVAWAAFAAQIVQHVQLLRRMRTLNL